MFNPFMQSFEWSIVCLISLWVVSVSFEALNSINDPKGYCFELTVFLFGFSH